MVVTTKMNDGNFMIMVPDEGIKNAMEEIKAKENLDTFDIGMLDHYNEMNNYYEYVITCITEYITKNQRPNYYKLIDIAYHIDGVNYVQCYIIKCNSYDVKIIGKKISNLINRKKEEYTRNYLSNRR